MIPRSRHRLLVVVVTSFLILSGTGGFVFADVVEATQATSVERDIANTQLAPGESTQVTVTITTDNADTGPSLTESFSSAFGDVSGISESPGATLSGPNNANDEYVAAWSGQDTTYTATYEVTIPSDASHGDVFEISGTVDVDGNSTDVGGETTIEVLTAERSIESTNLAPGESTNVTVSITTNAGESPSLTENFNPAFASVTVSNQSPTATITGATDNSESLTADWGDSTTEYTLTYQVTVDENASDGTTYQINGSVTINNQSGAVTGDGTISISTIPDEASDYADESGSIGTKSLFEAFNDWEKKTIDIKLLLEVFQKWQSGE